MSKTLNIQYCSYLKIWTVLSCILNSWPAKASAGAAFEADITRYTCISISRCLRDVWMRNVAVKGWYRTVRSLPTARGRRGMTGGQWGALPMTNSACFQSPESLGGLPEQPQTRRWASQHFQHRSHHHHPVMFQTVYTFLSERGGGLRNAGYFCLWLYRVSRDVR